MFQPKRIVPIEVYSSMECPYAYLAVYRLRQVLPEFTGRLYIVWRALSLEWVNESNYPKPLYEAEFELFQQIEPRLPWQMWARPDWHWPSTYWPAFEALACAQLQGSDAAFEMSWALRRAYFAENRNLSLRHEILAIVEELSASGSLSLRRFEQDWNRGVTKYQVIQESRSGWRERKLNGSATFVFQDRRTITNPAIGEIDFDEENACLRSYKPYEGDPLEAYRQMLESALNPAG
jgi:predicted DsbA family dithiol-disulfide isomerase